MIINEYICIYPHTGPSGSSSLDREKWLWWWPHFCSYFFAIFCQGNHMIMVMRKLNVYPMKTTDAEEIHKYPFRGFVLWSPLAWAWREVSERIKHKIQAAATAPTWAMKIVWKSVVLVPRRDKSNAIPSRKGKPSRTIPAMTDGADALRCCRLSFLTDVCASLGYE